MIKQISNIIMKRTFTDQPTIQTILQKSEFQHVLKNVRTDIKKLMFSNESQSQNSVIRSISNPRRIKLGDINYTIKQTINKFPKSKFKPLVPLPPSSSKSLNSSKQLVSNKIVQNQLKQRISVSEKRHRQNIQTINNNSQSDQKNNKQGRDQIRFSSQKQKLEAITKTQPSKIHQCLLSFNLPEGQQRKTRIRKIKLRIPEQQQTISIRQNFLIENTTLSREKIQMKKQQMKPMTKIPQFLKPSLQLKPESSKQINPSKQQIIINHFYFDDDKAVEYQKNPEHEFRKTKCAIKSKRKSQRYINPLEVIMEPKVGPMHPQKKTNTSRSGKIPRMMSTGQNMNERSIKKAKKKLEIEQGNVCGWELNSNNMYEGGFQY